MSITGTWTLQIVDTISADSGALNSWSLNVTTVGGGGGGAGQSCGTVTGNPFVNCGFETGDFSGWVVQDILGQFMPLSVDGADIDPWGGFFLSSPTEGSKAALHGFDGTAGTIRIAQDISLPGSTPLTLYFDYRGAWDTTYGAVLDRTFIVNVEPSGGGASMQSTLLLTAPAFDVTSDTGPLTGTVDLTSFAGQDVRISFDWMVPEDMTGPGFFQLDNIYVVSGGGGGSPNVPPVASSGVLVTDEDVQGVGTLSATDDDSDPMTYSLVGAASYGTVVINSTSGNYTYTQNAQNWNGSDSFTFMVNDGTDDSNIATVYVTVSPVNDAPTINLNSSPEYIYTKTYGSSGSDYPSAITVDSNGNLYAVGRFVGTVNFAVSFGGTDNKTSVGTYDGYITKINADGTYGWTKTFGSTNWDGANDITLDSDENIYVTGSFVETVNFASDFGGTDNKTATSQDGFVMKIEKE